MGFMKMNIKSKSYCQFCEQKCRVERSGFYFCPNGHYVIKQVTVVTEPIFELIQPASTGNGWDSINVYRLNSIKGEFCDDTGKLLTSSSDFKKDESLKPEVV